MSGGAVVVVEEEEKKEEKAKGKGVDRNWCCGF